MMLSPSLQNRSTLPRRDQLILIDIAGYIIAQVLFRRGHPGRCSIARHIVTPGGLRCGYDGEKERAREIPWLLHSGEFRHDRRTKLGGMRPRRFRASTCALGASWLIVFSIPFCLFVFLYLSSKTRTGHPQG